MPTYALILGFCILCCAYSAQYWAFRSHQELKKMNEKLEQLRQARPRTE